MHFSPSSPRVRLPRDTCDSLVKVRSSPPSAAVSITPSVRADPTPELSSQPWSPGERGWPYCACQRLGTRTQPRSWPHWVGRRPRAQALTPGGQGCGRWFSRDTKCGHQIKKIKMQPLSRRVQWVDRHPPDDTGDKTGVRRARRRGRLTQCQSRRDKHVSYACSKTTEGEKRWGLCGRTT